jgi:hypothetical protein
MLALRGACTLQPSNTHSSQTIALPHVKSGFCLYGLAVLDHTGFETTLSGLGAALPFAHWLLLQ